MAPRRMILSLLCWSLASAVGAQSFHEPIEDPRQGEVDVFFSDTVAGAFEHAGQTVLPPAESVPTEEEPAMRADTGGRAMDGVPGRQAGSFRPDRVTDFEGNLGYEAVFTPSIAPFKRVTVLSRVGLQKDGRTPVLLPLKGPEQGIRYARSDTSRDSFWGSTVLDFSQGRRVPIPSVAPDSNVLEARLSTPVGLRFSRDANGIFFVTADADPGQRVRLNYLMDAPKGYFGMEIPTHRANLYARRLPPLPAEVRAQAAVVTDSLALYPDQSLAHVLKVLTGHFRSFVESPNAPPPTERIYVDLALGMKGVCRHRAYAFAITAQSLGIHARFVMNEAHAWVEVEVEPNRWLRIDLGGAADGFNTSELADRPRHAPSVRDTLPKPPAYQASQEVAAGASLGSAGGAGTGESAETGDSRAATGNDATSGTASASAWIIDAEATSYRARRGKTLTVRGFVRDARGRAGAGLRLEARLAAHAHRSVTLTERDGSFSIEVPITIDAAVGVKDLTLTLGD